MTSNPAKVSDYISILERQNYSYLMMDGGIIQIAFIYQDRAIIRHRLAYHPCPFDISAHDVAAFDGGLVDLIQNVFLDDLENNVLLRSPIRFDYAPDGVQVFHPASHFTVNDPTCRVPVRAPMQFDTFMKFILENFYLDAWKDHSVVRHLNFSQEPECLSGDDKRRAYLHWDHP
jgi:hypothetical protein